jgi:hypothetical protein
MRAADGANALEENYRRWLRSMRDRIDSELAGEERAAAEWLKNTLPRLEEDYKRLHRKREGEKVAPAPGDPRPRIIRYRRDDEMPEESKLQMLKDFVLDSMLRETEVRIREEEEEKRREREEERLRRKKHLVATGAMLSSFAVFIISGPLISRRYRCHHIHMSLSEFAQFMSFESAVLALFVASDAVRNHLSPPHSERPMMKSCPDRSRAGLLDLLPS